MELLTQTLPHALPLTLSPGPRIRFSPVCITDITAKQPGGSTYQQAFAPRELVDLKESTEIMNG